MAIDLTALENAYTEFVQHSDTVIGKSLIDCQILRIKRRHFSPTQNGEAFRSQDVAVSVKRKDNSGFYDAWSPRTKEVIPVHGRDCTLIPWNY